MAFENEKIQRLLNVLTPWLPFQQKEKEIMLNVRIATPPFDRAKNDWSEVNPGVASSYIFSKRGRR